jgi:DNA polymerase III subunit delta
MVTKMAVKKTTKKKNENIYFFSGVNDSLKEKEILSIKEKVLGKNISEFNYNLFYADSTSIDEVINTANTLPFASLMRLIILKRAELYSAKDKKKLVSYVENPADFTCLIISSSERPNKKESWYKGLSENSIEKVFWPLNQAQLAKVIREGILKYNKKINSDALLYFTELIGENPIDVDNEVNKLVDFIGVKDTITLDDIKSLMTNSIEHNIYKWAAKVTDKKYREALNIMQKFSPKETSMPNYLLYILVDRYIKILKYITMIKEGEDTETALRKLGVIKFLDPYFGKSALGYNKKIIGKIFDILLKVDLELKTSSSAGLNLLEKAVIDIAMIK